MLELANDLKKTQSVLRLREEKQLANSKDSIYDYQQLLIASTVERIQVEAKSVKKSTIKSCVNPEDLIEFDEDE